MDIPQNCQDALVNGIQQIGSANVDLKPSHSFASWCPNQFGSRNNHSLCL